MTLCLIVDDDPDCRDIDMIMCKNIGFEVASAEDGQEAIEYCEKRLPDLILLDWMMPRMSGIEFLHKLRQMEHGKEVHVLMISAKAEETSINAAKKVGADGYLPKPFTPPQLMEEIINTGILKNKTIH